MANMNTVLQLQNNIQGLIDTEISMNVKVGRGKLVKVNGVVINAYRHVFAVRLNTASGEVVKSYKYCDIISGSVKIVKLG